MLTWYCGNSGNVSQSAFIPSLVRNRHSTWHGTTYECAARGLGDAAAEDVVGSGHEEDDLLHKCIGSPQWTTQETHVWTGGQGCGVRENCWIWAILAPERYGSRLEGADEADGVARLCADTRLVKQSATKIPANIFCCFFGAKSRRYHYMLPPKNRRLGPNDLNVVGLKEPMLL
ncbi:hypothetical protein B0H19DRAFT_1084569 [Mycena capillaripes]|nr:hypothetical protein B0H19DRAFT_1084569 [Mycena capillaripes]